jgi:hypothetical protein
MMDAALSAFQILTFSIAYRGPFLKSEVGLDCRFPVAVHIVAALHNYFYMEQRILEK